MPEWLKAILSEIPDDGNWSKRRRMAILQRWPLGRQAEAQADSSLGRPDLLRQMTEEISEIKAAIPSGQPPEPEKGKAKRKIAEIERETLMNRAVREFMLLSAEAQAAAQGVTPEQLYEANPAYKAVKDVDNQIAELRKKIK